MKNGDISFHVAVFTLSLSLSLSLFGTTFHLTDSFLPSFLSFFLIVLMMIIASSSQSLLSPTSFLFFSFFYFLIKGAGYMAAIYTLEVLFSFRSRFLSGFWGEWILYSIFIFIFFLRGEGLRKQGWAISVW